jgi:hypothetical protein
MSLSWRDVVELAGALPEVSEELWYGTPGLKVHGKGFARLKEDGASVMFHLGSVDEQRFLLETQGDVYFITDHYRGYAAVLARLSALTRRECSARLELSWRSRAPKAVLSPPVKSMKRRPTSGKRARR